MADMIDLGEITQICPETLLDPPGGDLYLWDRFIAPHVPGSSVTAEAIRSRRRREARQWHGRAERGPSRLITNPKYLD
jgi:hypothetical protein